MASTISNAIHSKRTTIGGIGVILTALGGAFVAFGDGTTELGGFITALFGVLANAYGMFNARDNHRTSEEAVPDDGGFARRRVLGWVSLVVLFIALGCAGLGRRVEDALDRASIPVYREDAAAELAVVEADIATSEAWLQAGPAIKTILRLSDEAYERLMTEAEHNLAYKKTRRDRLEAVLPTLPTKPEQTGVAPAAAEPDVGEE